MAVLRADKRGDDELRPVSFELDFLKHPLGSTVIRCGNTRVLCSVSDVPGIPGWMREQQVPGGWLTAEYRMLPGATPERARRQVVGPGGRATEIQRLIGRSLRAVVDLTQIGQRTLYVDCDVLDADGGTRCAAITGASIALELALRRLFVESRISTWPLKTRAVAVSAGIVEGRPMLDLCYSEDAAAAVDMNVVMTAEGNYIEIQGTAEETPFSAPQLDRLLALARSGAARLADLQRQAIDAPAP
ncbi:MAG: ribonuclease PH [Kiritimatiellaeota bacterium]|nr:ribonuclease PH [Kiritimatiellota bacterium]